MNYNQIKYKKMKQVGDPIDTPNAYPIHSYRPAINNYEQLTTCIQNFRQIPESLESYLRSPHHPQSHLHLQKLMLCSNNFVEVANLSIRNSRLLGKQKQQEETVVQMFHRFFSRIREILYYYLGKSIHFHGPAEVREFIIDINKEVLKYNPDSQPSPILATVAQIIRAKVKEAIRKYPHSESMVAELLQQSVQVVDPEPAPQHSTPQNKRYYHQQFSAWKLMKQPQDHGKALLRKNGLEVLIDLDLSYFRKITQQQGNRQKGSQTVIATQLTESNQLAEDWETNVFKECLQRNKYIQSLIKGFIAKYELWNVKPPFKKNRLQNQYRPTSCEQNYRLMDKCLASRNPNSTNKPRSRPPNPDKQIKTSNSHDCLELKVDEANDDHLRESLIKFLQINRHKQCLNKVILIGTNLEFTPTLKNKKRNRPSSPSKPGKKSLYLNKKMGCRNLRLNRTLNMTTSQHKLAEQGGIKEIENLEQVKDPDTKINVKSSKKVFPAEKSVNSQRPRNLKYAITIN